MEENNILNNNIMHNNDQKIIKFLSESLDDLLRLVWSLGKYNDQIKSRVLSVISRCLIQRARILYMLI